MSENAIMRANALSTSRDLQRAEQECERLRKENASLREANEIDLGEKMPLLVENAHLRARVKELEQIIKAIPDDQWSYHSDERGVISGMVQDYRKRLGIEREVEP
jgi:hypothetical protein